MADRLHSTHSHALSTHTRDMGNLGWFSFSGVSYQCITVPWGRRNNCSLNFCLLLCSVSNFTFGSRACCFCCWISLTVLFTFDLPWWSWISCWLLWRLLFWFVYLRCSLEFVAEYFRRFENRGIEVVFGWIFVRMLGSGVDLASEVWIWTGEVKFVHEIMGILFCLVCFV